MNFTVAYKPGGMIFLLLLLIFLPFSYTSISDKPTMYALLASVSPTPFGWSSATNFCLWQGVICDSSNRVVTLSLASQSLSGTLPPSLNTLSRLTTLSIGNNHFSGPLPSLANLSRLRKLYLHNNSFTSIPQGAFSGLTNLRILRLSNNTKLIPWPFPSDLVDSHKLVAFYASNANIMGTIPDIFRSFPVLVNLTLSHNNLTGSLPSSFINSMIRTLKVDNQKPGLSGNINVLPGMNQLTLVWLQGNNFTGVVPSWFVLSPHLAYVRLENNKFKPPIPHFPSIAPDNNFPKTEAVSFNCVLCKAYTMADVAKAPVPLPGESSSENNPNIGLIAGLTFLLAVVLACLVVCLRWHSRRKSQRVTLLYKEFAEQKGVSMVETIPQERNGGIFRPGEEKGQPSRIKEGNKKPEKDFQQPGKERHKKEEVPAIAQDRGNEMRKQPQEDKRDSLMLPKKYSFNYIRIMTQNFDRGNIIGEGGFARVYKGTLLNGTIVAAKRPKQNHGRIINDFKNEVDTLGRTSHINLVKLIGYCVEGHHRMLVYEYVSNGSLEKWIFGSNPNRALSWLEMKIVFQGIAEGLVYLHEDCEKKILHRDLKPQNVLLDEKKNAKLCDFGISKQLEKNQSSTSTVGWGTPGYIAPEVTKGGHISEKVDVYSFGIVVLEVIFGIQYRRLVSSNQTNLEANQLPGLIRILNEEMRNNGRDIERIAKLAISCLSDKPDNRPTMSYILGAIKNADAKVRRNKLK